MILTAFTYRHKLHSDLEPVLKGDNVRPDESLSIREILDRFTRGVPAIGTNHLDFDQFPDAIFDDDAYFPDFPDFADYVYAEQRLNAMRQEAAENKARASAAPASSAASERSASASAPEQIKDLCFFYLS